MSILFLSVAVRHETRVRLRFSNTLASGAFGEPAPAYYTITNTDGLGPSPLVNATFPVSGDVTVVELALASPLVQGAAYTVEAVGVPATDLSVTAGGSTLPMKWTLPFDGVNSEPVARDRRRLLYGVDLLWNGLDYQESATGDLERVDGTANVTKALYRGIEANSLPWDHTYGAKAREFVDSPSTAAGTLKGSMAAQILRDPRVKAVKITYSIDNSNTFLFAAPTLVSGETVEPVSLTVPNS